MKNKLLVALFSLIAAFGCAVSLSACDIFGGGKEGDKENGNDNGEYERPDFGYGYTEDKSGLVITRYYGTDTDVTIPEEIDGVTVKEIGSVFNGDNNITRVTIPDTVTVIGDTAFANTVNLKEVVFSENLEEIGSNAFIGSGIAKVSLPATVKTIGAQAFLAAEKLVKFSIAAEAPVERIEQGTFNGCTTLLIVELSDNIKTIGQSAFSSCESLESIDLKHVETVEVRAFEDCKKLKDVDFGDTLYEIESEAFANTAITKAILPKTCTSIESYAFWDCLQLTEVAFPEYAVLSSGVLKSCASVETLTFPSDRGSLANAFQFYSEDLSEKLPNFTTLNVVGKNGIMEGFGSNISKLENITLDERISDVGADCFKNTAWYEAQPEGLVYLGKVLLCNKGITPLGAVTVKEGTIGIADKALSMCAGIRQLSLPAELKTIGANAFEHCSFSSLTLPENLERIGKRAFYSCTSLKTVDFNQKTISIGESAFENCDITGEVTLPSSSAKYDNYCFKGNENISKLTLSFTEGTTVHGMFGSVPRALKEIEVTGSRLPNSALYCATYVETVTLSKDITKIGDGAFMYCNYLTDFIIPDAVTEIGKNAFSHMGSLTSVTFGKNVKTVGENAFSWNSRLQTVNLNDGLEKISDYAFNNCTKLESIKLNSGLEYLGKGAFSYTILQNLIIPESVTYVGADLVKGNSAADAASFKLLVEATVPNGAWSETWNVNLADEFDGEIIYNYYPTYYYSETEKTDEELSFWHYVDGVPQVW